VFAGGDPPTIDIAAIDERCGFAVAADSGLDHALRLRVTPDLVVGDMDSVSADALRRAVAANHTEVDRHAQDKDATDLELALDAIVARGFARAVIVGGGGGRMSHILGNATLLASTKYQAVDLEWWLGTTTVLVANRRRSPEIEGSPGDLISLIPIGRVEGLTTRGLAWELDDEGLAVGTSRGISNRLEHETASVRVASGVVLVVTESGSE